MNYISDKGHHMSLAVSRASVTACVVAVASFVILCIVLRDGCGLVG
jgi:hypothetical protein